MKTLQPMQHKFKKISLLFLFMLNSILLHAQNKHGNIWYFGYHAGVDFNSGSPVPLSNGVLFSEEGCATVSDFAGNLLFYTNGTSVFNRLHDTMPNGTGLSGHYSTTQSSLIVAAPGTANIYYIFTLGQEATGKFCYSIVDMNLDSGKGEVTNKNTFIYGSGLCEKLAGTLHSNGVDVWIAVHVNNSNQYRSYLLTSSGLGLAVVSNPGNVHPSFTGCMKFSPNGNKLAAGLPGTIQLEILDFDNTSGLFSNPISFAMSPTVYGCGYGIEFSATGAILYSYINTNPGAAMYQFNMNAGSPSAILGSGTLVQSKIHYPSALQIGPDNKIYFCEQAGLNWLGVINNPDSIGLACNVMDSVVNLGSGICYAGLPNFISNVFSSGGSTTLNQLASENVQLTISPNPNNGAFKITLPSIIAKDFSIHIINSLGQVTSNSKQAITNGQNVVDIKIESPVKGLYLVEVINEGKVYHGEFMVR